MNANMILKKILELLIYYKIVFIVLVIKFVDNNVIIVNHFIIVKKLIYGLKIILYNHIK